MMHDLIVLLLLLIPAGLGWYFLYWPSLRATPVQPLNGTIPERNDECSET